MSIKKTILAMIIALIGLGESSADEIINLDYPGALEKLKKISPEHYQRLKNITFELGNKSPWSVGSFVQVNYNASGVNVGKAARVSYPPQYVVRFNLENVRYSISVTDWSHSAVPKRLNKISHATL